MNIAKIAKKIVKQCRVDNPEHFKLDDHDPAETSVSRPTSGM